MKLIDSRKAQVGSVQGLIMSIVVAAVLLAIGLLILSQISDASRIGGVSTGVATAASNATDSVIGKLGQVPTWIGIIVIVGLAMVVLAFFYGGKMGK